MPFLDRESARLISVIGGRRIGRERIAEQRIGDRAGSIETDDLDIARPVLGHDAAGHDFGLLDVEHAERTRRAVDRDMVFTALRELHIAPARIERDAFLAEPGDRRAEGREQFFALRPTCHQIARGVDRIGLVERHGPLRGLHRIPKGIEQMGAAAVEIVAPVPPGQRRTRRLQVILPAAQSQQRIDREFSGEAFVGERHRLGAGVVDLRAGETVSAAQAPLDLKEPRAGAQRARRLGCAQDRRPDDRGHLGIAQPVGIVAVGDIIAAFQHRLITCRHQPGHRRAGGLVPVAPAAAAIEQHQPPGERGGLRRGAVLDLGGRDVGNRSDIGMERRAEAIRGDRVDPWDAEGAFDRRTHLADILRLTDRQPGIERALIVMVGIAQGEGGGLVPREPGQRIGDERTVARRVRRPHHRRRAVGHRHADAHAAHLLALAIDQIGGRIGWIELELEHREMLCGGDGVRPGDILVEAERHDRPARQRDAHDVIFARHGQMHFVEAARPVPGEMRIADQHAALVRGHFGPECPAVAAEADIAGTQRVFARCQARLRGSRRRREHHHWRECERARQQHLLFRQAQHVVERDRSDPAVAATRDRHALRPKIAQRLVIAGEIAAHQRLGRGAGLQESAAQRGQIDDRAEKHVRGQIVDPVEAERCRPLWSEPARAVPRDGREFLRQHAQIVLRIGIGHAVTEPAPIGRADMRDAVSGACDGGGEAWGLCLCSGRAQQCCACCEACQIPHDLSPVLATFARRL